MRRLKNASATLRLDVLHAPESQVLELLNYGDDEAVAELAGVTGKIVDLDSGEAIESPLVKMPARSVRLLVRMVTR